MSNSANSALPTEVYKAAAWWRRQLEQSGKISVEKANTFESNLINLLREKVVGHWHPEKPWKGQGHRPDPLLAKAASTASIENIFDCFPVHLEQATMWIDPGEVVIKLWWSYFQRGVEEVVYRSGGAYPTPASPQKILSNAPPLNNSANEFHPHYVTPPTSPSPQQHYHTPPPSNNRGNHSQMYSWSPKSQGFTVTA